MPGTIWFLWRFLLQRIDTLGVISWDDTGKKIRSLEKKITFPGKNTYIPWKRNLGSCGPLVLWSSGPVVLWSCSPLVLWSSGPVVPWQRHEKEYVGTKKAWKECKRKLGKEEAGQLTNTISITTRTKIAKIGFSKQMAKKKQDNRKIQALIKCKQ